MLTFDEVLLRSEKYLTQTSGCIYGCAAFNLPLFPLLLQHFQRVIPHQLDSGPDKVIQAAYQVKYNAKKMKK